MDLPQHTFDSIESRGLEIEQIIQKTMGFSIDVGDWCALSPINRFRSTPAPYGARNTQEKIEDIAALKKHTGLIKGITANTFGLLNDFSLETIGDYIEILADNDIKVTSIMPNATKSITYLHGSISNLDVAAQKSFLEHVSESLEIGKAVGAKVLSLWFGDGTNYPGATIFHQRIMQVQENLQKIYNMTPKTMEIHLEYKNFEPATYHTDIPDWGSALLFAESCGDRMKVLMDTGHHSLGTNIEYIVSLLLAKSRFGSIHINSKKYADDDLNAGAINPYELFLILKELNSPFQKSDYKFPTITLDEFHHTKPPILGMLQSILYIEQLYVKSLMINWDYMVEVIRRQEIAKAEHHLHEAFLFDVSPIIQYIRAEKNLPTDSFHSFFETSYYNKKIKVRF